MAGSAHPTMDRSRSFDSVGVSGTAWLGRRLCQGRGGTVCAARRDPLSSAELAGRLARRNARTGAAAAASTRYGFYVDHMVDSFEALALLGGLALSGYIHPWIAAGLLVGFLMLSIQSYLATQTLGEFRLSFWRFGPTELRLLLALGNLALLWKPRVHFSGGQYRLFDVGGAIALAGMALMLICFTGQNTVRLYREERVPE